MGQLCLPSAGMGRGKEKGLRKDATLSEIYGDGPVRAFGENRPSQGLRPLGLPSGHGPPDCPDTSLQYHSRHWTTSFHCVAVELRLPQIWWLSNEITLALPAGAQE
ncbi:hypothetical protein GCM10011345_36230 [Gemmobacter megaterium]|nr:hypothetical protein GCM10011345_36230 [Gemmobacter megaterium]